MSQTVEQAAKAKERAREKLVAAKEDLKEEKRQVRHQRKVGARAGERIDTLQERRQKLLKQGKDFRAGNVAERIQAQRDVRQTAAKRAGRQFKDVAPARTALEEARDAMAKAKANLGQARTTRRDAQAYYQDLRATNPWLDQLNLDPRWIQGVIAGAASSASIVAQIRQTSQYRKRFVGINDPSTGQMISNEAEYIRTEDSYRQLLRQAGIEGYDTPDSLVGFFQARIDPNELKTRLEVYRGIKTGGQAVKDAFYVYAGMNITDDDLLASVLDPGAAQNLMNGFNQATASGAFNYQRWIARATEAGMSRVVSTLRRLQAQGAVTSTAVQAIIGIRPDFAQRVMSAIYQGAGEDTSTLSLAAALDAFEFAAIGSAAQGAGLDMPSLNRLRQIRAAGVDRARAIESYTAFGKNAELFKSAVARARGRMFGQAEFESATFLGNSDLQREFEMSMAQEKAAGESQGSFRFAESPQGRITQRGFGRGY